MHLDIRWIRDCFRLINFNILQWFTKRCNTYWMVSNLNKIIMHVSLKVSSNKTLIISMLDNFTFKRELIGQRYYWMIDVSTFWNRKGSLRRNFGKIRSSTEGSATMFCVTVMWFKSLIAQFYAFQFQPFFSWLVFPLTTSRCLVYGLDWFIFDKFIFL